MDLYQYPSRYEFLEIHNWGDEEIDLDGFRVMRVSAGSLRLRFDFTGSNVTSLGPGEYAVIVRSVEAFRSRYGDGPRVAGSYSGTFSNRGDTVVLLGPRDEPFIHFDYENDWYASTNGEGHSLVLRDPTTLPSTWGDAAAWQPSSEVRGSPGGPDAPADALQLTGDFNQDRMLNISDPVALLFFLFGGGAQPPCSDQGNRRLLDTNGDRAVDLADAVHTLNYLFLGAPPRALATECVPISGCPPSCPPQGVPGAP